jgi:predicted RNA-binding protein with RPS1 domain
MSKHKTKIEKLFEHPISGNIDTKKLIHALEHYGAEVDMNKQHRALVHINGKEHSITLSHRNELSKDAIVKLRHYLEEVGLTPDKL